MKIWKREGDRDSPVTTYCNKKIVSKFLIKDILNNTNRNLQIRKTGRIIDIAFPWQKSKRKSEFGFVSLTEAEILYLAKLCRRDRTDEAFMKAIAVAGEPPQKFRKGWSPTAPGDNAEFNIDA